MTAGHPQRQADQQGEPGHGRGLPRGDRDQLSAQQPERPEDGEVVTAPAYAVALDTPLRVRRTEWTLAGEYRHFERFDIGIMPLPDNRRSLGKASYKALQYMAAAIPPVASPVGTNAECIEAGSTGFLPRSDDEWFDDLCRLIDDPGLRQEVGDRGRQMVQERFSVTRWYGPFRAALEGRS